MTHTVKGELPHGLTDDGKTHKAFELRAATTGDMFDAEAVAAADKPLAYRGALIARQIVSLGTLEGPIDYDLIRRLQPEDFGRLITAQDEVERLGKAPSKD